MKIAEKTLERLCHTALDHLKAKHLITIKVDEPKVIARMVRAFQTDLDKEAKLDAEVRQMLEKFRTQIDRGEIDEQKMFLMIKKQLVKERGIVL